MNAKSFRVLHLNSMLRGGGTDDQCVKLAHGLSQLGHKVWVAGPDEREFALNLGKPLRVAERLDGLAGDLFGGHIILQ